MTIGITLPTELSGLLNTLGFTWPEGDEGKIFDMAGQWMSFADQLRPTVEDAHGYAERVRLDNQDKAVELFQGFRHSGDAPRRDLDDGATAATMISGGLYVCAGALVALKIAVIAQLVALAIEIAQAIAIAPVTFGASLLEIPVLRQITRLLLDQALDIAVNTILND